MACRAPPIDPPARIGSAVADIPGDQLGDGVVDLVIGFDAVTATGSARLGKLESGVGPSPKRCNDAIDAYGKPTLTKIKVSDIVCVRTSRGAIMAATVTDVTFIVNQYTSYSFAGAYWPRQE